MKISGKKGYFRRKDPPMKMSKDGKEIILEGKWHKIYAEVAPAGDDVYVPIVEEESGLTMMRFKDITLKVKVHKMHNLPGQKVSFFRKDPDKDITNVDDRKKRILPGKYVERPGRMGFDVLRVYIPLITTEGERVPLRFDKFVFDEKSKGDK
ncbi:hypothetical protein ES703_66773 [subsurface metagenome]